METKLANHPVGITHPGTLFWDLCDAAKVMYRASDSYLAPCKDEHYSYHSFALCDNNNNNIRPVTELPLVSRRRRTQKEKVVIKKKKKRPQVFEVATSMLDLCEGKSTPALFHLR